MEYRKAMWPVVCLLGKYIHANNLAVMVMYHISFTTGVMCMHRDKIYS